MIVTDPPSSKVSIWNVETYQRLKQALSIGLRRQIFVVVCDDLNLRTVLTEKLQEDLGSPQVVNLKLNVTEPNIMAQITQWLAQKRQSGHRASVATFQILGIELLTRQPASVQGLFLRHLQTIERSLSRLDFSLVLWLPRPWFYNIQQSAPEFWRWRTGTFEFEGEPTPVSNIKEIPLVQENSWQTIASDKVISNSVNDLSFRTDTESFNNNEFITNELKLTEAPVYGLTHQDTDKHQRVNTAINYLGITDSSKTVKETAVISQTIAVNKQDYYPVHVQAPDILEEIALEDELFDEELINAEIYELEQQVDHYLQQGNYYCDRIEQGDSSPENLFKAIQAYEQALPLLEKVEKANPDVKIPSSRGSTSDILNDLGNLYWMLSHCAEDAQQTLSFLQKAIASYQLGMSRINPATLPCTYAMIQNNLGAAYGDLAHYLDTDTNLQKSIQAYQEALHYRSSEMEPLKYASTQNNLGTAYWNLAQQQEPIANLKLAIAAYNEALSYYHPDRDSLNWAMIQNNLGTVYWNLAQYEQPASFLHLAIYAYQNALKYRTPQVNPAACAATQNNLGTAYWHLANLSESNSEAKRSYLDLAIVAYQTAIALAEQLTSQKPPVAVSFDLFAGYNNLGLAQYQLATDRQFSLDKVSQSAHLDAALQNHIHALQGFNNQPDRYQSVLSYIIKAIRTFHRELGIQGQNLALSRVPGQLLPEILRQL